MLKFSPNINKKIGDVLSPLVDFLHNDLGVTPNFVSGVSFFVGLIAVLFIWFHKLELGLVFVFLSLGLDGLDGPIARRFHYNLEFGEKLDTVIDRFLEIITFLSLSLAGYVDLKIVILSITAILLMTTLRGKSKFDPGFKRIVIFFGYFTNFHLAFEIIFLVNIFGFVVNLLILDIRAQQITGKPA